MSPRLLASRLQFLLAISLTVIALDQATKYAAFDRLTTSSGGFWSVTHPEAVAPVQVMPGFFELRYLENPAAAFSLLAGFPGSRLVFLLAAVIAMVLLILYYLRSPPELGIRRLGLALVLGGAVGNFIDRARLGYVIDFVHWHWRDAYSWPVFNVADVAISVGVVLLLLESFRRPEPVA